MPTNKKRIIWISVLILLFLGGIAGGYFYFSKSFGGRQEAEMQPFHQPAAENGDFSFVRIYYPSDGRLVMEERRIKRQVSQIPVAEAVIDEFLRGPSQKGKANIPVGTKVLGVYLGRDGILYIDLSDEFRRNFQGDAMAEFLLLKGLYDSIISNVTGVDDIKVLIEGKETESIGGHFFALYPLKNTVTESR